MKLKVETNDRHDWVLDTVNPGKTTLQRIAAIDISYSKTNGQNGIAYIVIMAFPTMEILYEDSQ